MYLLYTTKSRKSSTKIAGSGSSSLVLFTIDKACQVSSCTILGLIRLKILLNFAIDKSGCVWYNGKCRAVRWSARRPILRTKIGGIFTAYLITLVFSILAKLFPYRMIKLFNSCLVNIFIWCV